MSHRFLEFQSLKGAIPGRINGSLVSMENGTAIPYSIDKLQERGKFFIDPGEPIYEARLLRENARRRYDSQCDKDKKAFKCSCSWF